MAKNEIIPNSSAASKVVKLGVLATDLTGLFSSTSAFLAGILTVLPAIASSPIALKPVILIIVIVFCFGLFIAIRYLFIDALRITKKPTYGIVVLVLSLLFSGYLSSFLIGPIVIQVINGIPITGTPMATVSPPTTPPGGTPSLVGSVLVITTTPPPTLQPPSILSALVAPNGLNNCAHYAITVNYSSINNKAELYFIDVLANSIYRSEPLATPFTPIPPSVALQYGEPMSGSPYTSALRMCTPTTAAGGCRDVLMIKDVLNNVSAPTEITIICK